MLFADVALEANGIAAWLAVGLLAGWLAGKVMEEASFGIIGDLLVGAVGALAGGVLLGYFVEGVPLFWVTVLVAFIGACVLIAIVRVIVASRSA